MIMHLRSKLISEVCQKIESLDGETEQNCLKVPTLPTFFFKKHCFCWKNDKWLSISYCKNKCTYKCYVLMIKNTLRNMSESNEFRFENSLKVMEDVCLW